MNKKETNKPLTETIKAIIALHFFFCRKSQFYLNGDWEVYAPFTIRQKLYRPIAYIKFMYSSVIDVVKNPKYRKRIAKSTYR